MSNTPTAGSVDEILTKFHKKHYDTIDGVDDCGVALAEAKTALATALLAKKQHLIMADGIRREAVPVLEIERLLGVDKEAT